MRSQSFFWKTTLSMLLTLAVVLSSAKAQERTVVAGSLKPFVDNGTLAGAVVLVASRDKVLLEEAIGFADIEAKSLMGPRTLFWIASMSKPITAAALMMLIDEGKLKLDDPVEKHLPEFKGQMLVEKSKDKAIQKKPARPFTVKDLLTHTSGLVSRAPPEAGALDTLSLREVVRLYAQAPLQFEPGSQYQYNNPGINTAGRLIEVASGMSYEQFLDQRLLGPLGMKDTTFWPQGEQLQRLAKTYKAGPDKKGLEATPIAYLTNPLDSKKRHVFPGGGLFSSAGDVGKFCQMILSGGTLAGKRYLSESAVKQMTSTQTGDLKVGGPDSGYGLGWATAKKPHASFGHGGAYNTWMWIEPQQQLVLVLLVQHAGFPGTDGPRIRPTFQKTALEKFGK